MIYRMCDECPSDIKKFISWGIGTRGAAQSIIVTLPLLLTLPIAHLLGVRVDWVSALFTSTLLFLATTASCVSGGRAVFLPIMSLAIIPAGVIAGIGGGDTRPLLFLTCFFAGLAFTSTFYPFPYHVLLILVPPPLLLAFYLLFFSPQDAIVAVAGALMGSLRVPIWIVENIMSFFSPSFPYPIKDEVMILPVRLPKDCPPAFWHLWADPLARWAITWLWARLSEERKRIASLIMDIPHFGGKYPPKVNCELYPSYIYVLAELSGFPGYTLNEWLAYILTLPLRRRIPRQYREMFAAWLELAEQVVYPYPAWRGEIDITPAVRKAAQATRPFDASFADLLDLFAEMMVSKTIPPNFSPSIGENLPSPLDEVVTTIAHVHSLSLSAPKTALGEADRLYFLLETAGAIIQNIGYCAITQWRTSLNQRVAQKQSAH